MYVLIIHLLHLKFFGLSRQLLSSSSPLIECGPKLLILLDVLLMDLPIHFSFGVVTPVIKFILNVVSLLFLTSTSSISWMSLVSE